MGQYERTCAAHVGSKVSDCTISHAAIASAVGEDLCLTAVYVVVQEREVGGFKAEAEEEFEDAEGNVYNRRTYEDLKRQGLI